MSFFELRHVEAELLGPRLEVLVGELAAVLEKDVVHLPELALLARGLRSECSRQRSVVHGKGVVLEGDPHLVAALLFHVLERRIRKTQAVLDALDSMRNSCVNPK